MRDNIGLKSTIQQGIHMIWKNDIDLDVLNQRIKGNMAGELGIIFTEIGDDYLKATMPVDKRTTQPLGIVHGGASCVLAETVGSIGATMAVDMSKQYIVGVDINANHIKATREGLITCVGHPIHIGRTTQVWEMKLSNDKEQLTCASRLTIAILNK